MKESSEIQMKWHARNNLVRIMLTILLGATEGHEPCSEAESFLRYKRCGFPLVCEKDQQLSQPC